MRNRQESGLINVLLIPVIVLSMALIGCAVFAFWAYSGRQDYKNNTDKKIASAVDKARQDTQAADQALFDQQEKSPYKSYTGAAEFGALNFLYPKTWAGYVLENGAGNTYALDGYFYPGFVPNVQSGQAMALRVQIIQQGYAAVLAQYSGLETNKKITVTPYRLPKVPDVAGARLDGEIISKKQGSMILLPLRNLTVRVWTESSQYLGDFNNTILPNLVFSP